VCVWDIIIVTTENDRVNVFKYSKTSLNRLGGGSRVHVWCGALTTIRNGDIKTGKKPTSVTRAMVFFAGTHTHFEWTLLLLLLLCRYITRMRTTITVIIYMYNTTTTHEVGAGMVKPIFPPFLLFFDVQLLQLHSAGVK